MGARIKLNPMNEVEEPTLVLATRKGRKLGTIPAYNIVFKDCLNSYSEISFKVSKSDNGNECRLWDKLLDFKLLWCKEYDLWFEIYVEIDEQNDLVKNVLGKSVCEAELSQINLYNIEINTEDDIAREDYKKPTVFFNEEYPESSLLNRLMEKIPHYTIAHVESTLANIQKTFSFDNKSIYDAFQEIAEEVGCLFVFGSNSTPSGEIARTISVYDLQSNCNNCGYRGEFTDICPECESTSIKYGYGTDTGIFISTENLADNITYETDTDSVKNCFKLEAGDDLMNATIRSCNPNGTDYIWYISDSVKADMSNDLVDKIEQYDELYEECQNSRAILLNSAAVSKYNRLITLYNNYRGSDEQFAQVKGNVIGFPALMTTYYDTIDFKLFLQSGLMPSLDMENTTASEQAAMLTANNLSPVAATSITSLSKTIAENAVLGIAKIYINSNYTVKVNSSSLSGTKWTGNFTVTNNYDEEDTATSSTITVTINDDVETYLEQKISKALKNKDTDDYSITSLFSMDYDDFYEEIEKYSLNCLTTFYDACQAVLDILIEQASMDDTIYSNLYQPYRKKLLALQSEISDRETEIGYIENLQNYITSARDEIQAELDFEEFIGVDLWNEFCAYRRENKYSNSNYISDGLDNTGLFSRAQEFIEVATLEIYKSAELQHSITSTLKNLLAMEEFQPLTSNFEVGNWLRLKVDNDIYKLRLLEYEIDYDDLKNITVVFSDVMKISSGYSDVKSILDQAASMATSYDSVAHQASQGNKTNKLVNGWVNDGLALTNSFISDSDNQEIILDSHGITMREYLPITDTYSDKQLKIINKGFYFTTDNWDTIKVGVGSFKYLDPKNNFQETEGYGVIADTIVGNIILGEEVGVYNNGGSIILNEDGLEITNKGIRTTNYNTITINPNNSELFVVKRNNTKMLWFGSDGTGHFKGVEITDGTFTISNDDNTITIDPDNGLLFTSGSSTKLWLDITTGDVIGNNCTFNNGTFNGIITTSEFIGGGIYNEKQTTMLTLGTSSGNYGDLTLARTSDNTIVFQVYDDATTTAFRRKDNTFLDTSGSRTYMHGTWTYGGSEVATQSQIDDLQKQIDYLQMSP